MLTELNESDWREAFGYAGEADTCASDPKVSPVPGSAASASAFTRNDVALILGLALGEKDGAKWVCAGRLADGRWFCLRAGCDYTGWDCQAGGHASVALALADLLRLGMSPDERDRCGLDVDVVAIENETDEYVEREVVTLILRGRQRRA